jgi:hypothetical protein
MLVVPLVALGVLATGVSAHASRRAAGDFPLQAYFSDFAVPLGSCPHGYATDCFAFTDLAAIPGLGFVTERHTLAIDSGSPSCTIVHVTPVVWKIAHKGSIDATLPFNPTCGGLPTSFTITGGTGVFAGASGNGSFTPMFLASADTLYDTVLDEYWYEDDWSGTINLPNYTPDWTPPVIAGAHPITVTVAKNVRRTRVRFKLTARDDVDGSVPVQCKPKSGSFFKLGTTTVNCTASDYSANTSTAQFSVTVAH